MSQSFVNIEQARTFYRDADSAHDFEHILRVTRMAEYLARAEGGDVEIVRAAALLHDIGRHEEDAAAQD
ncbi:MAG TPA: HD domain-containing protein, partial [Anaerolineae bacterium]|nr:HD domain-containing protein [Anaerolineae bacterium]